MGLKTDESGPFQAGACHQVLAMAFSLTNLPDGQRNHYITADIQKSLVLRQDFFCVHLQLFSLVLQNTSETSLQNFCDKQP